jgi:hypothetical protein
VEFSFSLNLPAALVQELEGVARTSRCSPTIFAAESLENVLASRRLPRVTPGAHGPRVGGQVEDLDSEQEAYRVHLENVRVSE